MKKDVLSKEISNFFICNEFITLATCGTDMQPNVASKILLKVEGDYIYLGDYNIDRTWMNIHENPKVSFSCIDHDSLVGYQINGTAVTIDEGPEQDALSKLFTKMTVNLSTNRVIDGIRKEKKRNMRATKWSFLAGSLFIKSRPKKLLKFIQVALLREKALTLLHNLPLPKNE